MKKQVILILILLVLFPCSSYAELSKQDIQEIRTLVREEISAEVAKLNLRIDELEKRVNAQIGALDSKLGTVQWTLNILIVIIVAILALPQAVSFIRERRESQELAFIRQQILEIQKKIESGK